MQGRFKRDGSASAEPEPHNGAGNGSSPQHAQNAGQAALTGDNGERSARLGSGAPGGKGAVTGSTAATPPAKPAKGPSGPGARIALRNWRISTRLVSLLALPVVAATSLGALRISDNMDDIQQLDNMRLLTDITKQATELSAALQEERDQSAGPLAHGQSANDYSVKGVRDKTDRALANFLDGSEEIDSASRSGNLEGVRESLVGLVAQLTDISEIRSNAYEDKQNSTQTVESYHRLVTQLLELSQDMAEATSNPEMITRTRALAAFSSAKEYASVQRAVIAAALPEDNKSAGRLSENDRLYAESALSSQDSDLDSFISIYGNGAEDLLKPIDDGSPTITAADLYAKRVLTSKDGLQTQQRRSYKDWVDADSSKIQQMKTIEITLLSEMEQKARELRNEAEREAIISGALILLVLGVSLVGAFVVARSMIRSLRRLQDTATKVAQDRLPELVKQLSESDPQDVDTSVESVGVHSRDEIGQVAAAFDDVHREAVRLAAEQALLRGNVNAMFTNLSRRSQGLIQRQLSLISELESREADPDQLSSLFKLDHLATRMRRNGENLLVLAGEEPGRRWTRPVPLVDVLRAAASEVEQYERIELSSVPTTEVAGRVVNDLVHLLAELLENATSFSSPQTKVKVTGHALPDGRVLIEIHDTGIGLSPEDLAAINERLAAPPTVDVSVSRRMGLFVVGRLSQRHGIRIQLRPSDSGGTTALVMLPVDVAQGGKKPAPGKAGQGGAPAGGPAAAQAAAGVAAARRGGGQGAPAGGGLLGAGAAPRGQVGSGQGARAALPGRDAGGRPGGSGGAPRGPQGPGAPQQNSRPAPAGAGGFGGQAPGAPQGLQAAGGFGDGSGARQGQDAFGNSTGQQDAFGGSRGPVPPQRAEGQGGGRRPQLPPRGGARPELPGGNAPSRPSWSDENAQPPVPRASLDTPRGHEEPDSTSRMPRIDDRHGPASTSELPAVPRLDSLQNPAATSEFARPDYNAPRPGGPSDTGQFPLPGYNGSGDGNSNGQQNNGSYVRSDVFGTPPGGQQNPQGNGQFTPSSYDNGSTGQFPAPTGYTSGSTGQFPAPSGFDGRGPVPRRQQDASSTGQFERPQPGAGRGPADFGGPRPPVPPQPEALPPASGPGDGRTPLYDTLETNWFHGQGQQGQSQGGRPQANGTSNGASSSNGTNGSALSQPSSVPAPPRPVAAPAATGSWRTSPNDELVRQAERVRQPAAGGVTTSGLPRRVPRANLVPGTAQQQQHQSGPAVSRAPDDVRGRLTNLRRGIAQGRQAGTGSDQTGSFPSPTHQQER
ncbi:nitrate- and nitrite sensing domain-containing protein [Streptomyces sp. WI04-05B]|uniref:sensor histidine kinase n=1 Tax=Streptomyces TaxID=1883 RepID=UPI0029AA134D|nr:MULTISPECIES: nitrate- and nitrite sensing domain-containing protein [unclassified Streptomyces]MDX2541876.1 nitrate- and nitrite sensing domain-containing protein [Streptomyces sp. WI04-05B]MDX2586958.1 nitrate- and nitrite sensing domain-containing protein [Streptomyces sp. WI04-05A]